MFLVLTASLGFALFAATGARRTSTAFDRFVAWSHPPDAVTTPADDQSSVSDRLDQIAALRAVSDTNRYLGVTFETIVLPDGTEVPPMRFAASVLDFPLDESVERAKVIEGDPNPLLGPDDGIIDFVTAERFGLGVGDRLRLRLTGDPSGDVVEAPVTVAAVISTPQFIPTVASYRFAVVGLGRAFLDAHPWAHDESSDTMDLRLRGGAAGLDDLASQMEDAGLDSIPVNPPLATAEVGAERLFSLEATAMWAAAFLALLAGLPIAYQLTRRDASAKRRTIDTLLAIGVSRRQVAAAAAARGAALGAIAALVATGVAIATSPLSPVGLARFAEIDEGIRVDGTVLAIGLTLFVLTTAVLGAAGIWRGALGPSASITRARQPLPLTGRLPVAIGVRMAGSSRSMASIAGIGALVTAVTLVVGVAVTVSSVNEVPRDARLAGGVWDAYLASDPEQLDAVDAALDDMPAVVAHGRGGWAPVQAGDQIVVALSLPQVRGMTPAITRGRAPHARDEVALGAAVMDRLGVEIGDEVELAPSGGEPRRELITGETIQAAPLFFSAAPDDAALITWDVSDARAQGGGFTELLRFTPGADPEATMDAVVDDLPKGSTFFYFARGQRGDVIALGRLEGLLRSLFLMVAGLALASLVHHILVTTRRHSGSLATLRALGLTRGNIGTIGASIGLTTGAVTALCAAPLGLAVGSVGWRSLARRLVVLPEPTIEVAATVLGTMAVVLASTLFALVLTRRGARGPVALSPHAE